MAIELFNDGTHKCILFVGDAGGNDHGVQANQLLIVNDDHGALIDPGGWMTYRQLASRMQARFNCYPPKEMNYILASHAGPGIMDAISKWMFLSECKLMISSYWAQLMPSYYSNAGFIGDRIHGIPDSGMDIQLGNASIKAVPAHFMHSEGNFQFYDPVSKILFSGEMGASFIEYDRLDALVEDFEQYIPFMESYHQRYMVSSKICKYWANMVRQHDVEWIVPQHGRSFKGKKLVGRFLDWVESSSCGVDNMTQANYCMP